MPQDVASKFDSLAEGFAENSYANLDFYMKRRLFTTTTWGKALSPGDSVMELGCGDGYLARLFVEHGLHYCGVDISPKMIAVAQRRLTDRGLEAKFVVADVSRMTLVRAV